MFSPVSGRDENEKRPDAVEESDESYQVDEETEYEPLVPTLPKAYVFIRCVFFGLLIGGLLALLLAVLQVGTMPSTRRFGVPRIDRSSFFLTFFFDNLKWSAWAVFLGLLILNAAESLLQWNYDTTRRATRAMIRNIRRAYRKKSRGPRRRSREKSAQKIVEPIINDLNLEIDDDA